MSIYAGTISGPIAPYNNPPIQPQFYKPRRFVISAIALGPTTIVTTTLDHDFSIGQEVRLLIPNNFGSIQLNGVSSYVVSIPQDNQVVLTLDSNSGVNPFISATVTIEYPQIIPIGDINSGKLNFNVNLERAPGITGSFKNISPR